MNLSLRRVFYRFRLALLMAGLAGVLRLAALLNPEFRRRLAATPFAFVMTARDRGPARYFRCAGGKLQSSRKPMPRDFGLIWRDSRSGGQVMIDMVRGKPKALYQAVVNGVLQLEGDGKMVAWFLETINRLNRVFRPRRRAAGQEGRPRGGSPP